MGKNRLDASGKIEGKYEAKKSERVGHDKVEGWAK